MAAYNSISCKGKKKILNYNLGKLRPVTKTAWEWVQEEKKKVVPYRLNELNVKNKSRISRSWRDGPVGKSECCSTSGLEFGSQHTSCIFHSTLSYGENSGLLQHQHLYIHTLHTHKKSTIF